MSESAIKQQRLNYLHNLVAIAALIKVARADHSVSDREMSFLYRQGVRFGISKEYIDRIMNVAGSIIINPPDAIQERLEYLEAAVQMAMIDGFLHPRELDVCREICKKLSFKTDVLDEIILTHDFKVVSA